MIKIAHPVTGEGSVYCERQKRLIDVVMCYGCDKLVEIDLDSRRPRVVCAAPSPGEPVRA